VITPSLPTFFIALAIILPIVLSPLGEIVPDLGDLVGGLHLPGAAFDVFDDGGHRDVDVSSRWDARRRRRARC
jgi:hypothetical protein